MAKTLESGEQVGVISQVGERVLMHTQVSGGSLPKTFSTVIWAEFDFSGMTADEVRAYAAEAVRIRVRSSIWTSKTGCSTTELKKYESRETPYKLVVKELSKRLGGTPSMEKVVESADVNDLDALIKMASAKLAKIKALEALNGAMSAKPA